MKKTENISVVEESRSEVVQHFMPPHLRGLPILSKEESRRRKLFMERSLKGFDLAEEIRLTELALAEERKFLS